MTVCIPPNTVEKINICKVGGLTKGHHLSFSPEKIKVLGSSSVGKGLGGGRQQADHEHLVWPAGKAANSSCVCEQGHGTLTKGKGSSLSLWHSSV